MTKGRSLSREEMLKEVIMKQKEGGENNKESNNMGKYNIHFPLKFSQ